MSEAKAEYYVVTPDGVVKPIDIAALVQPDDIPRDALWQSASGGHVCGECRDCKWWHAPINHKDDFWFCDKTKGKKSDTFYSKPDYGCIHWEAKE